MKNIFNHQLINLRMQKQLSQNDLANKIYVSRQAISKWERSSGIYAWI
ncbi:helix-turn-helix transcriptional regulator [Apilactobacillus xinyiensis]|nr:helix-turn-helix transcriptional regulator [Apilactobacillus xinyiensis]MCL0330854.1 helix-turn-helix domain-containing protein [Apilactobacillus xinyiensis]